VCGLEFRRRIQTVVRTRIFCKDKGEGGAAIAIFTVIMLGISLPAFFFIAWAYTFFQAREQAQLLVLVAAKAGASQTVAFRGDDSSGVVEISCRDAIVAAEQTWDEVRRRVADGSGYPMLLPSSRGEVLEASCTRPAAGEPVNRFAVTIEDTYRGNAITGWLGFEADFVVSGEAVVLPTES
jgi:hypothetical protein